MIYVPRFMKIGRGVQAIFEVWTWETLMMVLLMWVIYGVHHRDGLMWHDIPIKFHYDQFRHSIKYYGYCRNNSRGFSVGIADGRDLRSTLLRSLIWPMWHYMHGPISAAHNLMRPPPAERRNYSATNCFPFF
jgi:hypothetical protein